MLLITLSGCDACVEEQPPRTLRSLPTADLERRPDTRPAPAQQVLGQRSPFSVACEPPMLVGVGNVDGRGRPEIIVACDDALLVLDEDGKIRTRAAALGWPHVLLVADLEQTGTADILAAWGTSRRRRDTRARLLRYRLQGDKLVKTVLMQPTTTRNQFCGLALERAGKRWSLVVSHFISKYMVRLLRLSGGKERELGTFRMAMSLALSKAPPGIVVGRLYGDRLGVDGDAFLYRAGRRVPIPTTRGVQAVAAADLDGDGKDEIVLCDGWAQSYAKEGRALLTAASWDGARFRARRLAEIPGEYAINEAQVIDVDGDKTPEILARGSSTLRLYRKGRGGRWTGVVLARNALDAVAADLDDDGLAEVVVLGKEPAVINLRGVLNRGDRRTR